MALRRVFTTSLRPPFSGSRLPRIDCHPKLNRHRMFTTKASQSMPQPPYPLHPSVKDRIDPEYASYYNKYVVNQQQPHYQPLEASRSSGVLLQGGGPLIPVGTTVDHTFVRTESQGPDIGVRCFSPEGHPPADGWPILIYFHGGGWVLGNIDTENVVCTNICARAKCVVVTVDYRHAPEDPFPAAIDDAWEAVQWVSKNGKEVLRVNPNKMAVGGSSAGGNLAAVMCQRAVTRGSPAFRLQLHSVPIVDNTANVENNASWAENQHAPALPAPKMLWFREHYLPNKEDWANPEASPLLWQGDWSKLPPAIIVLGELDVLCAEGKEYGAKMEAAGVKTDVHVLKGMPHPFLAMAGVLQGGKQAITWFCDGVRDVMYGSA